MSKTDVENIPEYREALDLERLIASSPIRTVSDVRAKLLHVQRGVETGELGTGEAALDQVIDWLADKERADASQIASTWNVVLANWLVAKGRYRLADVESLRLGQEAKALETELPEELTLNITLDGVPRTIQLQSYGDIDHWLSDLPHRKGRREAAIAALANWYGRSLHLHRRRAKPQAALSGWVAKRTHCLGCNTLGPIGLQYDEPTNTVMPGMTWNDRAQAGATEALTR
ncbi:MAG: hypothetical protein ACYDD1_09860 [Caulobacteraceae bacterium]